MRPIIKCHFHGKLIGTIVYINGSYLEFKYATFREDLGDCLDKSSIQFYPLDLKYNF